TVLYAWRTNRAADAAAQHDEAAQRDPSESSHLPPSI
ncbi:DUF4212 domain-containing protein, partial [Klebsiella michiganensis]